MGLKDRVGRFKVPLECFSDNSSIELMTRIMGQFLIVRAETIVFTGMIEYMGISQYFDEIEVGMLIPWYQIELEKGNGKIFLNSVEKMESECGPRMKVIIPEKERCTIEEIENNDKR